ncbi:germin protein subfamily [Salix suchowensis]|nr:germin protein subfamily [Salix suchowensis]
MISLPPFRLLGLLIGLLLLPFQMDSTVPDHLQDFCVADLKSPHIYVTSDDLFFDGLGMEGNTAKIFGWSVTTANLLVGFVQLAMSFDSKVLTGGQKFVVPTGLIHFQLEVGEGNALIFTTFNSHSPGSAIAQQLFCVKTIDSDNVLTKAFQVGNDVIDNI